MIHNHTIHGMYPKGTVCTCTVCMRIIELQVKNDSRIMDQTMNPGSIPTKKRQARQNFKVLLPTTPAVGRCAPQLFLYLARDLRSGILCETERRGLRFANLSPWAGLRPCLRSVPNGTKNPKSKIQKQFQFHNVEFWCPAGIRPLPLVRTFPICLIVI